MAGVGWRSRLGTVMNAHDGGDYRDMAGRGVMVTKQLSELGHAVVATLLIGNPLWQCPKNTVAALLARLPYSSVSRQCF